MRPRTDKQIADDFFMKNKDVRQAQVGSRCSEMSHTVCGGGCVSWSWTGWNKMQVVHLKIFH